MTRDLDDVPIEVLRALAKELPAGDRRKYVRQEIARREKDQANDQ
jgi:hypothetical protein